MGRAIAVSAETEETAKSVMEVEEAGGGMDDAGIVSRIVFSGVDWTWLAGCNADFSCLLVSWPAGFASGSSGSCCGAVGWTVWLPVTMASREGELVLNTREKVCGAPCAVDEGEGSDGESDGDGDGGSVDGGDTSPNARLRWL